MKRMPRLDAEKLKFLDETGFQREMRRANAWSKAGTRSVCHGEIHKSKNVTVVAAISIWGPEVMMQQDRGLTKIDFERFVSESLGPVTAPGDIIVMDNLRSHHSPEVQRSLSALEVGVLFLPPYSPDLNPIEKFWVPMKTQVRSRNCPSEETAVSAAEFSEHISKSWDSLSKTDTRPMIEWSGYRFK